MSDITDLADLGFRIDSTGGRFLLIRNVDSQQVPGGNFGPIDTPDFTGAYNDAVTKGLSLATQILADEAARAALGSTEWGVSPGYNPWGS